MKRRSLLLAGLCGALLLTACQSNEQNVQNQDSVTMQTAAPTSTSDAVITEGDSTTLGEIEEIPTTPSEIEETSPMDAVSTEENGEVTETEDGVVEEPSAFEDIKVDDSLGDITVSEVENNRNRVPVVIREIDTDRLRLLVRGYDEEAQKYVGEASFISCEGASVKDLDGKELSFADLKPGSVVYVELGNENNTELSAGFTDKIIRIQE